MIDSQRMECANGIAMKPSPIDFSKNNMIGFEGARLTLYRVYRGPAADRGTRVTLVAPATAAWLILSGRVEIRTNARTDRADAGNWMFIGPGPRHQWLSPDCELLSIIYRWEDPLGRPIQPLKHPFQCQSSQTRKLNAAANHLLHVSLNKFGNPALFLKFVPLSPCEYARLRSAFYQWIEEATLLVANSGLAMEAPPHEDPRVHQLREALDSAPLGDGIDYTALARACGVSRPQIERLFRREFFLSPHAYFDRRRMDFARKELLASRMNIKEIASELGFRHLSRFSGWFSSREQRSPREFRKFGPLRN
jgi:AraC-like DNA-binding protein